MTEEVTEEIGLHNLRPNPGSTKATKRLGRGKGSGQGKTAGKGHKGYNARSGGGELTVALTVRVHMYSRSAVEKIEAAGGKAELL